ncbi:oxaloacetate decarboxylase [Nocardia sp. XZ_19_369]|uniref:isocitrate lyase/PEP mutase family protein n=1 Tax=Nocardia sp. XZ_19_369 TaxID=2769487 RepID=UPI00188F123E|nr:isocitrate lyase/PEP mutase family protein [Nocardia sp. XZ_19_369]
MNAPATVRLRELLNAPGMVLAPGVGNGFSAQIARDVGASMLWASGLCAAANIGLPDIGLATMTEMVHSAATLVEAVPEIPILADADNGYGESVNVRRTVRAFEQAGVAGIQLEDQVSPKRCGYLEGKKLITKHAMQGKLSAAREACSDPDFVLLGRTDARAVHGLDDAIDRADAYLEAGADLIIIEAPRSLEELKEISQHFRDRPGKLVFNRVVSGLLRWPDTAVLEGLGATLLLDSTAVLAAAAHGTQMMLRHLIEGGDPATFQAQYSFRELTDLTGLPQAQRWEQRFDDYTEVAVAR